MFSSKYDIIVNLNSLTYYYSYVQGNLGVLEAQRNGGRAFVVDMIQYSLDKLGAPHLFSFSYSGVNLIHQKSFKVVGIMVRGNLGGVQQNVAILLVKRCKMDQMLVDEVSPTCHNFRG